MDSSSMPRTISSRGVTDPSTAQTFVILLCVSIAILFYSLGKMHAPPVRTEYRYIPRNQDEAEKEASATSILSGFL